MNGSRLGTALVLAGIALVILGLIVTWGPGLSWLGRLPGDIAIKRDNVRIYIPVTTCILLSLVVTFLLYLFRR